MSLRTLAAGIGRPRRTPILVLAVLAVVVASGSASAVTLGGPSAAAHGPIGASAHGVAAAAKPAVPTASPIRPMDANSSGRGTFFNSTSLPSVPTANMPCPSTTYVRGLCQNNTDEPSLNLTTDGTLIVAYTAYANLTSCANFASNMTTEVGIATSSNLGATWSLPSYVGNPDCTGYAANFINAAQPSVTSLANGTIVLAYEQYNLSCLYCYYPEIAPNFYCYYMAYDRIVVSESYDDGVTWTDPTVVDNTTAGTATCAEPSFPDLSPSVGAVGQSIYVAWFNYTQPYFCGFSSTVDVISSPDGGATWSAISSLTGDAGTYQYCYPSTTVSGMNPSLLVVPNGTVYVGYAAGVGLTGTNLTCCFEEANVALATSTTNGSSWTYQDLATNQFTWYRCCSDSVFQDPVPRLAYSAVTGDLYATWASAVYGNFCENDGYGTYCSPYNAGMTVSVDHSADGGTTWSLNSNIAPTLINPNGGPDNFLFNPSLAVTSDGVLHLQMSFENDSVCALSVYSSTSCGAVQQVYVSSRDNGTTFSLPVLMYPVWTVMSYPTEWEATWLGEYSSALAAGPNVLLAWTLEICPTASAGTCYGYYTPADAQVMISTLFHGTGITLSFTESGLPSGTRWAADVLGNYRTAIAPAGLSVSGVPAGALVGWDVPWVNISWGVSYQDTISPTTPGAFATSTTISASFTQMVLVTVTSTPYYTNYCWAYPGNCNNYGMTPTPGATWVVPGTTQTYTVSPAAYSTYCYCDNLSFSSWTGSGPGNVTTLSSTVTFTPTGPVNETANFVLNGWCFTAPGFFHCVNATSFILNFTESGLPANVPWGVTTTATNGTQTANVTSAADYVTFHIGTSPTAFSVWTVPDPSSGDVWVPTTDIPSPVQPISGTNVHVTFVKEPATSANFATEFVAAGLPANTPWSLTIGASSYGVQANNTTLTLPGGGPYAVNASEVFTEAGVAYVATGVSWSAWVVNSTPGASGTPGSISLDGPTVVTITFAPLYYLTVSSTAGGTVGPASGYYPTGTTFTLTATANAGYHFVGWLGSGSGSTTTAQDSTTSPTITPTGPVSELATFRLDAPPTWNVTVVPGGLPAGTSLLLSLGPTTYAGSGAFLIGNLANGTYAVGVPYVYLNASQSSRFVASSVASSLPLASGVLDLVANGTLWINFTTEVVVDVTVTPAAGGTVAPAIGAAWTALGTAESFTATPAVGYLFLGWNSSDPTVGGPANLVAFSVTAPIELTAQFEARPAVAPATFDLLVTETGLPTGATWNVSLGAFGATGSGTSLVVAGLNGSYALAVPTVGVGVGTRYAANLTDVTLVVGENSTLSIAFAPQYELTVTATVGGTVTPTGSSWFASGSPVTLTATPNATSTFVGWVGSSGGYSGSASSTSITVTGPVTEAASFAPVAAPAKTTSTSSGTDGLPIALGLLIALLVVGLIVGVLLGRRRGGAGPAPPAAWEEAEVSPATPGEAPPGAAGAPDYLETDDTREQLPP